jgi:heat shock protein HslJ
MITPHASALRSALCAGLLFATVGCATAPDQGGPAEQPAPGAQGGTVTQRSILGAWTILRIETPIETIRAPGDDLFIEFAAPGDGTPPRAYGMAGVNRFSGGFSFMAGEMNTGSLKAGPFAMTMMAGPEDRMAFESSFTRAMESARTATFSGDDLVVDCGDVRIFLTRRAATR